MGVNFEFYISIMTRCINFIFRSKPRVVTIDSLQDEVLVNIFQFLPLSDLLKCEQVSCRWRKLTRDPRIWRNIEVVCTSEHGQICPRTLTVLKTHCEMLGCLKMQYILKYPLISSLMNMCKNLCSLELIMCRIQVEFEEDLKLWPNLKRLNLKNSILKNKRPLLLPIDHCTQLTFLHLSDFGLTTENCNSLLQCQYLNHILMEKIMGLRLDFMKTLISNKQETLLTLHIYGGDAVDDDCLMMLAQCKVLNNLCIYNCENLTDRALDGVAKIEPITHLQLWANDLFSEKKLHTILAEQNLRKLQRLSLSKIVNITGAIVDVLTEYYTNLTFLALYRCPRVKNNDYEKQLKAKFRNIQIVLY